VLELVDVPVKDILANPMLMQLWNENLRPLPDTLIGEVSLAIDLPLLEKALADWRGHEMMLHLKQKKGQKGWAKFSLAVIRAGEAPPIGEPLET
jgi:hypothetical protein